MRKAGTFTVERVNLQDGGGSTLGSLELYLTGEYGTGMADLLGAVQHRVEKANRQLDKNDGMELPEHRNLFDIAKHRLIGMLNGYADVFQRVHGCVCDDPDSVMTCACTFSAAAEDVNLWLRPGYTRVGGDVFFILYHTRRLQTVARSLKELDARRRAGGR